MAQPTTIRTLEAVPLPLLTEVFNAAFAGYAIPFTLDELRLRRMLQRRGFRPELSVGVFAADRLVGFTCTGIGTWRGEICGYDSGTGVVPEYRGRGLAAQMMEATLDRCRAAGATRYVLEVIRENTSARKVYEKCGFTVTRDLSCWRIDAAGPQPPPTDLRVLQCFRGNYERFWDWSPSWQNSTESIGRAEEHFVMITAMQRREVLGYAVICPETGDLPQIAVSREHRRHGIGRALLGKALDLTEGSVRVVNTDGGDSGTSAFFTAIGAEQILRQVEMDIAL